jgi:hypothetical protein
LLKKSKQRLHHGDVILLGKQTQLNIVGRVEFVFLAGDDESVLNSNFFGEARTSKAWPPDARKDNKESPERQDKPWSKDARSRSKNTEPYVMVLEPKGNKPDLKPKPVYKSPERKPQVAQRIKGNYSKDNKEASPVHHHEQTHHDQDCEVYID